MEITPGIAITGNALYLPASKAIIVSDLHLGHEESLARQGVLVPRQQYADIARAFEAIFKSVGDAELLVLNGDVKHDFGRASNQEWRDGLKLFEYLSRHAKEIVIVKGNHDVSLGPIANFAKVKMVGEVALGDALVLHGDVLPAKVGNTVKTIIIGHEHAAIALRDGPRSETFKCFLKGKWKGKNLIVMPSFNPLVEGTNVLRDSLLSPFLKGGVRDFEVFVADDEPRYFGNVKDLTH